MLTPPAWEDQRYRSPGSKSKFMSYQVRLLQGPAPAPPRLSEWCGLCRKRYAVPQKMKHRIAIWSSSSTPGSISARTESRQSNRHWYTPVPSGISHHGQRVETAQVSVYEWTNEMCCTHTLEYYSALKRRGILTCTTRASLEDVMLSEINPSSYVRYLEESNP